ncbi:hypothetical protein E3U55_05845 [Filobacillus milosensis]|uniref:Peptidyl-prolyl cis-trans isomerase n=1 Tax=Filobacillus milosensis TaxID=94137 RepID=A0A4Y8IRN7_9BACI|nr:hypothetical protein [Filobacillus milosensis]TFB23338.1 hypothetical protein E3U55_05845 [Filobacillus milosensis]
MLIVQIQGNVKHPITLDPTVWIFDDRKILFDSAFNKSTNDDLETHDSQEKPWNRDQYQQSLNPPINESVKKFDRRKVLENSYVMPLNYFLPNSEPSDDASKAILHTQNGDKEISFNELSDSLLLFALNGKPLKEDGPVHLFFGDGQNYNDPIKGIHKITIQ